MTEPDHDLRRVEVVACGLAMALWLGPLICEAGRPTRGTALARGPSGETTEFTPLLFGPGLDPTTASQELWEALPGIGPKRASAIVDARNGSPFCAPGDLRIVPGLGPKTLAALSSWLAPVPWAQPCREGGGGSSLEPLLPPDMRKEPRLIDDQ